MLCGLLGLTIFKFYLFICEGILVVMTTNTLVCYIPYISRVFEIVFPLLCNNFLYIQGLQFTGQIPFHYYNGYRLITDNIGMRNTQSVASLIPILMKTFVPQYESVAGDRLEHNCCVILVQGGSESVGEREREREREREGGREGGRVGGWVGGREGGWVGGREGERERERER